MEDRNQTDEILLSPDVEQEAIQQWETLGISNDFVFCKVMQDESLLADLIHLILPELVFDSIHIEAQKTIEEGLDIHGVRFDIFVTSSDGTVVEIEMQVVNTGHLPKRLRFYGSMADSMVLGKGELYSKLKDSYVILICPFDPYDKGLHIYTFTNRCHQVDGLEMGDGTTKIVLNATSTQDDVSDGLKAFLDYVAGREVHDTFVDRVDAAVKKAQQNKEWRREYMTLFQRDLENREMGKDQRDREKIEEMLRRGKMPEDIADFCGYPLSLVKEVERNMLTLA